MIAKAVFQNALLNKKVTIQLEFHLQLGIASSLG